MLRDRYGLGSGEQVRIWPGPSPRPHGQRKELSVGTAIEKKVGPAQDGPWSWPSQGRRPTMSKLVALGTGELEQEQTWENHRGTLSRLDLKVFVPTETRATLEGGHPWTLSPWTLPPDTAPHYITLVSHSLPERTGGPDRMRCDPLWPTQNPPSLQPIIMDKSATLGLLGAWSPGGSDYGT